VDRFVGRFIVTPASRRQFFAQRYNKTAGGTPALQKLAIHAVPNGLR